MSDLSGFWIGHYSYEADGPESVDFDAEITQAQTVLTGVITEPNSFVPSGGQLLTATLTGAVSDNILTFIKVYTEDVPDQTPIIYNGVLSSDQNEIEGTWNIESHKGTFSMRRDGPPVAVEAQEIEASLEQFLVKVKKD